MGRYKGCNWEALEKTNRRSTKIKRKKRGLYPVLDDYGLKKEEEEGEALVHRRKKEEK